LRETEESRDSPRSFQQVTRDKNPLRAQIRNLTDDGVMPRQISLDVKVTELDCSTAS